MTYRIETDFEHGPYYVTASAFYLPPDFFIGPELIDLQIVADPQPPDKKTYNELFDLAAEKLFQIKEMQ